MRPFSGSALTPEVAAAIDPERFVFEFGDSACA
jgi:hypothetical protein